VGASAQERQEVNPLLIGIIVVLIGAIVALAWLHSRLAEKLVTKAINAADRKSTDEMTVTRLLCTIAEKIHGDNSEVMAKLVDRATTISDQEIKLQEALLEIDRLREAMERKQATPTQQQTPQPDDMFG